MDLYLDVDADSTNRDKVESLKSVLPKRTHGQLVLPTVTSNVNHALCDVLRGLRS